MATSRVVYDLFARDVNASREFRKVGDAATGMERTMKSVARGAGIAMAAVGIAAAAVAVESVKAATGFQSAMERIHTQAGASQKDVNSLTKSLLKMAPAAQQGPQELADSLYHLKSVGMDNAKAMKALKQSSDLAAVGGSNLEDTTNALAGAWRSGIKGAHSFRGAVATLNAITGAGNMKMQDLTDAMSTGFLPAAKTFGISLKSVGAALALMTDEGIPAQLAATRLRMTISLLGAPSKTAAKQLASIGLSSTDLANKMRSPAGLVGAVQMLKDHLDASGLSATQSAALLSRAFGGGRSSSAIMTMLNNLDVLQRKQDQINGSIGKYGPAVVAQRKTASAQFALLRSDIDTIGVQIGLKLLPPVTAFVGWLAKTGIPGVEHFGHVVATRLGFSTIGKQIKNAEQAIEHFFGISTGHSAKHVAATGAAVQRMGAASATATGVVASSSQRVWANIQKHTATHMAKATSPAQSWLQGAFKNVDWSKLGRTIGAGLGTAITKSVGVISGAFHALFGKIDWMSLGRTLGTKALPFAVSFAVSLANSIFDPTMWWNILKKNWKGILVLLASIVTLPFGGEGSWIGAFSKVLEHIPFLKIFAPILRGAERFFAGPFRRGMRKILGAVGSGFMKGLADVFPEVAKFVEREGGLIGTRIGVLAIKIFDRAKAIGQGILDGIEFGARKLGQTLGLIVHRILKRFVGSGKWLWGHGRSLITGLLGGALAVMATVPKWLHDHVVAPIINHVRSLFGIHSPSTVFATIGHQLITGLINGITGAMKGLMGAVNGVVTHVKDAFKGAGSWLYSKGKSVIGGLRDGMQSAWGTVKGWVSGLGGWIKNHKGPLPVDRNLLKPAGHAIMGGLLSGLKSAWSKVSGFLHGATNSVARLGKSMAAAVGWTGPQWQALYSIGMRESGWNPYAVNRSSGAYGIGQSLGHGHPYNLGDAPAQISWMINYIKGRYGTPMNAWAHEQKLGWYSSGAWNLLKDQLAVVHRGEMIIPREPATQIRRTVEAGGRGERPVQNNTFNIYEVERPEQAAQAVKRKLAHMLRAG